MKRSIGLFMVPFVICTCIFLVIFGKACGDFGMDVHAKNGIPFSHKTHVQDRKYDCDTCHGYYENGRFIGIPTAGMCKNCHASGREMKTMAMRLPYLEMYKDNEKAWSSHATQPPLVFFSHRVVMGSKHGDGGGKIACGSCHGDMANNTDGSRIRGRMAMGVCEDCHNAVNVSNKCSVCHD